jgi:hypothetical protein
MSRKNILDSVWSKEEEGLNNNEDTLAVQKSSKEELSHHMESNCP